MTPYQQFLRRNAGGPAFRAPAPNWFDDPALCRVRAAEWQHIADTARNAGDTMGATAAAAVVAWFLARAERLGHGEA
jgi:hypothetical protein